MGKGKPRRIGYGTKNSDSMGKCPRCNEEMYPRQLGHKLTGNGIVFVHKHCE